MAVELYSLATGMLSSNEAALIGDSRASNNFNLTTSPVQTFRTAGWAGMLQAATRGAIQFPADLCFAVAGTTTAQMISGGQHASASASRAGLVFIFTGTNSFFQGVSAGAVGVAGSVIDDMAIAIRACTNAGKLVVLVAECPRGSSGAPSVRYSTAQLREALNFRDWARRRSGARSISPLVRVVDLWPDFADQTYNLTSGDCLPAYYYDSLHFNEAGMWIAAQRFLKSLGGMLGGPLPLLPPCDDFLTEAAGDLWNAACPAGNLLTNGMLGGTGGNNSAAGTLTGTLPASWTASVNGGWLSGSPTAVGSQVTTSTGAWYQVVLGGTSGATSGGEIQFMQTLTLANLSAGDVLKAGLEFEVDTPATGLVTPYLNFKRSFSGGSETVGDMSAGNGSWPTTAATFAGVQSSPPLTYQGNETSVQMGLNVRVLPSTALSATIRFRKATVRKVL